MSAISLQGPPCLQLGPRFANQDAFGPLVTKFCTSAVSEPRTTTTATTSPAGFVDGAAFGTYGSAWRRACWCFTCEHWIKKQNDALQSLLAHLSTFPLDLRSQAFRPSNHLCSMFLLPGPPQFLYQAPPGAQQLTRPDFSNMPHFEHAIVLIVRGMDGVLIAVLVISFRSVIERRDTY